MSDELADFDPPELEVKWSIIKAKFPGRCITCGDWIFEREIAEWAKGCGVRHQERNGRCIIEMDDGSWRYAV